MATLKANEVLNGLGKPVPVSDWYGNPIPADKIPKRQEGVKGERGADGRLYLRPWSPDGKPGKRAPLEDSYLVIHDEAGRVVYDFGSWPPDGAKIEPGYVGFIFEEILKSYFGETCQQTGPFDPKTAKLWLETTEDGEQFWRWNVVWLDRIAVDDPDFVVVSERNENGTYEKKYDSRCDPPQLGKALIQRFQSQKQAARSKPS